MLNIKRTPEEINLAIAEVNANFAIEGLVRTPEEIDRARRLHSGVITFDEGMKELIENYESENRS